MAELTEASTAGEAKNFLLYHMDSTDARNEYTEDPRSKVNPSLTKEQAWNVFYGALAKKQDSDSVHYLILRNMIKEFGAWYGDGASGTEDNVEMTCIGCGLPPGQIEEYIEMAREEGTTPEDIVRTEEGTYNMFQKHKFYCTSCYIGAGMPVEGEVSEDDPFAIGD